MRSKDRYNNMALKTYTYTKQRLERRTERKKEERLSNILKVEYTQRPRGKTATWKLTNVIYTEKSYIKILLLRKKRERKGIATRKRKSYRLR